MEDKEIERLALRSAAADSVPNLINGQEIGRLEGWKVRRFGREEIGKLGD